MNLHTGNARVNTRAKKTNTAMIWTMSVEIKKAQANMNAWSEMGNPEPGDFLPRRGTRFTYSGKYTESSAPPGEPGMATMWKTRCGCRGPGTCRDVIDRSQRRTRVRGFVCLTTDPSAVASLPSFRESTLRQGRVMPPTRLFCNMR